MSSWLYSRNLFTLAPRSLVGPHFPYIIMAIEGGNSTEAMDWPLPPQYKKRPMYWSTFITCRYLLDQFFLEKFATVVVAVATFVVDQIATIVVAEATIVIFLRQL